MSSQVKLLNIEPYLGKTKNRLAFLGIELEGGWKKLPDGTKLVSDGSVFQNGIPAALNPSGIRYLVGELPSDILDPVAVPRWIKKFYPDIFDKTCGLHVHMSFRTAQHYSALMVPEFQETLLHHLALWGKRKGIPDSHCFWSRLEGKNTYCTRNFWADSQALAKKKAYSHDGVNRYTVLNYCWGLHGTIECRVLPMLPTVDLAISAIKTVMNVTNASLVALKQKEKKSVEEIVLPAGGNPMEEIDQEILMPRF